MIQTKTFVATAFSVVRFERGLLCIFCFNLKQFSENRTIRQNRELDSLAENRKCLVTLKVLHSV